MKNRTISNRRSGSMLVLTCVLLLLVVLGLVTGMSFGSLYIIRLSAQSYANQIAMAAAQILNHDDREGQMNKLVSRSRQLVFSSRATCGLTAADYPFLDPLAKQFLDEAREGARYVESERFCLRELIVGEATEKAQETLQQAGPRTQLNLPWIQVSAAHLSNVDFGRVDEVQSSVVPPAGIPALAQYDQIARHVPRPTDLYRGNINAKLPSEDADLAFNLASLAAPVEQTVSQARLILPESFQDDSSTHLPSAVKVELVVCVATKLGAETHNTMRIVGTATGCGALPSG